MTKRNTTGGVYPNFVHPMAWCRYHRQLAPAGPISWFTALGSTPSMYNNPGFQQHLRGGILCAAKAQACDCTATLKEAWQKVQLANDLVEPMAMTIANDGRIWCG
jgi:cytochrome c